jgi:1-acyl-sn-glycerol-3-phosphate acyltransferase
MDDWKIEPAHDLGLSGLARYRSLQRESGLVESAVRVFAWSGIRAALHVFHRMQIHGRQHLPEKPSFVMVANHASHLDALVLGSVIRLALRDHIFPLAAGDVFFENLGMSALVTTTINALPVWRRKAGRQAVQALRDRLVQEPSIYILFPEGGRTRDGNMLPFKSGVGMMVAGTPVPVVPCYLEGTFEAFPANRIIPRFHRIQVRIGQPLVFATLDNNRAGWDEITKELENAVRGLSTEY